MPAPSPVFSSQPHAPRWVMRTSISSACVTFWRDGVLESSPTKPTPHASRSFPGSKRPCVCHAGGGGAGGGGGVSGRVRGTARSLACAMTAGTA